ncbi:MAG: hypothetical protein ABH950_01500 [Candidatus Altiarchaeota archaeon]
MRFSGRLFTVFVLISLGFVFGCTEDLSQQSGQTGDVVCEAPYIRYGADCCLDQDANGVCDADDQTQTTVQAAFTTIAGAQSETTTPTTSSPQPTTSVSSQAGTSTLPTLGKKIADGTLKLKGTISWDSPIVPTSGGTRAFVLASGEGGGPGYLHFLNAQSDVLIRTINLAGSTPPGVPPVLTPDGKLLLVASSVTTLKRSYLDVFDAATGNSLGRVELKGLLEPNVGIAASPDSKKAVVLGYESKTGYCNMVDLTSNLNTDPLVKSITLTGKPIDEAYVTPDSLYALAPSLASYHVDVFNLAKMALEKRFELTEKYNKEEDSTSIKRKYKPKGEGKTGSVEISKPGSGFVEGNHEEWTATSQKSSDQGYTIGKEVAGGEGAVTTTVSSQTSTTVSTCIWNTQNCNEYCESVCDAISRPVSKCTLRRDSCECDPECEGVGATTTLGCAWDAVSCQEYCDGQCESRGLTVSSCVLDQNTCKCTVGCGQGASTTTISSGSTTTVSQSTSTSAPATTSTVSVSCGGSLFDSSNCEGSCNAKCKVCSQYQSTPCYYCKNKDCGDIDTSPRQITLYDSYQDCTMHCNDPTQGYCKNYEDCSHCYYCFLYECGNDIVEYAAGEECEDHFDCEAINIYLYCGTDCLCYPDCQQYCDDQGINGYNWINTGLLGAPTISTKAQCTTWANNKLQAINQNCFTSCVASAFYDFQGETCCCVDWNSITCNGYMGRACPGTNPLCPPADPNCLNTL